MNRSVIPKNWKEIQKKYYNKEPIIQGIKEAKYLNAKQDSKEIPVVPNYSEWAVDLGLPSGTIWSSVNIGQLTSDQQENNKYYEYDSDIVKKEWNEEWDLPTEEQVQELIDNTNIEWSNSKKGYYFYSKTNENNIFLLAAGTEVPNMLPDNPHTEIEYFGESGTYMIKGRKILEFMDEMTPRIAASTIGGEIWVSVRPVKNV